MAQISCRSSVAGHSIAGQTRRDEAKHAFRLDETPETLFVCRPFVYYHVLCLPATQCRAFHLAVCADITARPTCKWPQFSGQ